MLVWKKSIECLPPHQQSVFGWKAKSKVWIRDIWWDEQEETWNTDDIFYDKDDISHWMEHPSAPDDDEVESVVSPMATFKYPGYRHMQYTSKVESVVSPTTGENPGEEITLEPKMAEVPDDADLEWWLNDQTSQMDDESRANILAVDAPDGMNQFGFFTGMGIRNYYGLWHDNGLTRYFNNVLGVYHADDMSGVLLEALWYRVHNKPYDPTPLIKRYHEHWKRSGCNMKGEHINAEA